MGRSDVIFTFDDITWAAAQRRGMCFPQDRVALALIDDERIRNLLICDQPRSAPVKLAKGLLRRAEPFPASDRVGHYQPLRLRRRDPVRLSDLERYYASYGRRLQRAAERRGLERPAVITAHPFVAAFAALDVGGPGHLARHRRLGRPSHLPALAPRLPGRLRADLGAAELASAPSPRRSSSGSPRAGPRAVVPNGVDPAQWLDIDQPPEWMAKLPGPRFFYVGTLDSRLDIDAVLASLAPGRRGRSCSPGQSPTTPTWPPSRMRQTSSCRNGVALASGSARAARQTRACYPTTAYR